MENLTTDDMIKNDNTNPFLNVFKDGLTMDDVDELLKIKKIIIEQGTSKIFIKKIRIR